MVYFPLKKVYFFKGCEVSNCFLTRDSNYFGHGKSEEFDAIVFGMPHEMSDEVTNISIIKKVFAMQVLPKYTITHHKGR